MSDADAGAPARRNRWRMRPETRKSPEQLKSRDELQEWIAGWIAEKLGVPVAQVGLSSPFSEFGLDSLAAVELSGRLEKLLGCEVSPSAAWEYPTIAELSQFLAPEPDLALTRPSE